MDVLEQVRTLADAARIATEDRDTLIRMARGQGLSLRAIAEAAGLSHTAVAKIAERG